MCNLCLRTPVTHVSGLYNGEGWGEGLRRGTKTLSLTLSQRERETSKQSWLAPYFVHSEAICDSTLTGTVVRYSSPAAHIARSTFCATSLDSPSSTSTTISS